MKTLVRTIALITVISLGCVCFSGEAEKVKEKEKVKDKTEKLEEALRALQEQKINLDRNQEDLKRQLAEIEMQRAEIMETVPQVEVPAVEKMSGIFLAKGRGGQSADISVVITSEDEQPESISQVTEDMGIMARIFDKEVFEIPVPKQRGVGYGDMSLYMYTGAIHSNLTKGIYISDFGALFLMEVDFPLKPEQKAEEKEEEKAEVPDVWEQTKGELKGWHQGPGPEPDTARIRRKAAFDKSKVEEFKEKLIKALKYASNIRGLEPGDDIIVSVKSTGLQGSETRRGIRIINRQIGGQTVQTGGGGTGYGGGFGGGTGYGGGFAEEQEPNQITGMTIIVSKDDVDSFAEGEIDYEEFCEDVEIIMY